VAAWLDVGVPALVGVVVGVVVPARSGPIHTTTLAPLVSKGAGVGSGSIAVAGTLSTTAMAAASRSKPGWKRTTVALVCGATETAASTS